MLCRPKYPVITLTTDFGVQDHYVASMKGVILSVNPATPVVDITHEVPPFSILSGAYAISQAAPCFPPNTVHVVVVDPGVGTARRPILMQAGGQVFVGPDNGVFSLVAGAAEDTKCFEITRRDLMRPEVSATFHGRDIFAPVGAAVASGKVLPADVGPEIVDWIRLNGLTPEQSSDASWQGRVLSIDRFGNVITNFRSRAFAFLRSEPFDLTVGTHAISRYGATFGEIPQREIFAYPGSSGYIEIGINQGNAASRLQCASGQSVTLQRTAGRERQSEKAQKAV